MLLGLSQIIDCPGGVVPFETTLDLSDMVIGGSRPFPSPIEARSGPEYSRCPASDGRDPRRTGRGV